MEEKGVVTQVTERSVEIEIKRHSGCRECGLCFLAGPHRSVLRVEGPVNVKPGDEVIVSVESRYVLKTAFLVYLLPLLGLIFGYLLAREISGSEKAGILFAVCGLLVSFAYLYLYDKKIDRQRKYGIRVRKVNETTL